MSTTLFMRFWEILNLTNKERGYPELCFKDARELWEETQAHASQWAMERALREHA